MSIDFEAVRAAYPLSVFFENDLGAKLTLVSGRTRANSCPSCGESSANSVKVSFTNDEFWKCFACGESGDVVDAAVALWGCSKKEAVEKLVGVDQADRPVVVAPRTKVAQPQRDDEALADVFALIRCNAEKIDNTVLAYLQSRGLTRTTIDEAVRRGMLAALPSNPSKAKDFLLQVCGQELLHRAGLWKEGAKAPAIAFKPIVFFSNSDKAAEFRIAHAPKDGEMKAIRYGAAAPWLWKNESDRVMVTEGAIDMLSAVQLGVRRSVMGLPGCENWKAEWFAGLAGKDVMLALDNDEPGRDATEKLTAELARIGATVSQANVLNDREDLNEFLGRVGGFFA